MSGADKVFPPFQTETFASQLLWLTVSLAALYFLMARVAVPRIQSILESRRARITDDLMAAERSKQQSNAAEAAYRAQLSETRRRAEEIINMARAEQSSWAENVRKKLKIESRREISEAETAIAEVRKGALANVWTIAEEVASAITEGLAGYKPTKAELAGAVTEASKSFGLRDG